MKRSFKISPLARAMAIFAIVTAVVAGTTYALLQGKASLVNNTISSATAQLQVRSTGSFAAQDAGFAFTDVILGGTAVPEEGFDFQLRNNGDMPLEIAASIPEAPVFTVLPGPGEVDLSKVDLLLECQAGDSSFALTSDIATLVASHESGGSPMAPDNLPFDAEEVADCKARVRMDSDAFTGENADSTNFNIVFTATPINN